MPCNVGACHPSQDLTLRVDDWSRKETRLQPSKMPWLLPHCISKRGMRLEMEGKRNQSLFCSVTVCHKQNLSSRREYIKGKNRKLIMSILLIIGIGD